ncbi:hypothetical protein [Algoriphagus machipongonensis]|uniref:Uncharacterized protein n=1 Tax=Algoriphagus machipongonensis TaxID=388413 RepID=A3I2J8_9BACT|nr:hypothetical protein [Algoriphagus machipongonensis]EAZ79302.1 hypothetical protein ALPR1_16678 [Algoriphagus machipongonensis]
MKEVQLTDEEISILQQEINHAEDYRTKKLKEVTLMVIGGVILSATIFIFNKGLKFSQIIIPCAGLGLLMILISLIAWFFAYKPIKKMKNDLSNQTKLIGHSEIESINVFNRKITLVDGTKVWQMNQHQEKWKKGDLIIYSMTPSNEYIFECVKTPHNKS